MNHPHQKQAGRIIEWDSKKGYGFLHDGTHRIFLHRRDFAEHHKNPMPGDTVSFTPGTDPTGRSCAKAVAITGTTGRLRLKHLVVLLFLLLAPALALHALTAHFDVWLMIGTAVALSLLAALAYTWDKHRARTGGWRTAESTLHLLAFAGGWPGAYLAQHSLRHKTAKLSFLVIFWLIVAAHQFAALDLVLGWRLSRSALGWLQKTTAPSAAP
jgi:uncharacterized membrane protein YsdA (DUF1294 family)/cold shock CspA family protein